MNSSDYIYLSTRFKSDSTTCRILFCVGTTTHKSNVQRSILFRSAPPPHLHWQIATKMKHFPAGKWMFKYIAGVLWDIKAVMPLATERNFLLKTQVGWDDSQCKNTPHTLTASVPVTAMIHRTPYPIPLHHTYPDSVCSCHGDDSSDTLWDCLLRYYHHVTYVSWPLQVTESKLSPLKSIISLIFLILYTCRLFLFVFRIFL